MGRGGALGLALLALAPWAVALAHEGHDHGPPAPLPTAQALAPRASAETADFELVAVLDAGELRLYLDDFRTNRPVEDAAVEVESGPFKASARHLGQGVYGVVAGPLGAPGTHPLVVTVETARAADLLLASLEVPAADAGAARGGTHSPAWYDSPAVTRSALAGLALWVLFLLARRDGKDRPDRSRRRPPGGPDGPGEGDALDGGGDPMDSGGPPSRLVGGVALALVLLGALLLAAVPGVPALAHEGHDHGPSPVAAPPRSAPPAPAAASAVAVPTGAPLPPAASPAAPGSAPSVPSAAPPATAPSAPPPGDAGAVARLPDGSVFVPKPTQRLLGLRTAPAEAGEWPDAFALNGHVIPDPNASALVQAPLRGRIELPEGGLPLLGARVERGQVLGYLVPILDAVDRTTLEADLAELGGRIVIRSRNLERLRQLGPNAARQDLEETEAELESLVARRKAVTDSLAARLPLAAPVAGALALRNASPGQIVEARETLFTVVDPQRLWVEALLYDTEHATHFVAASARTVDGQELRLTPVGGGYELRGHALPLQFRIEPPVPFLAVRQPLRVFAQAYHSRKGLRIPSAAVVKGADGADRVWVHQRPEQFRAERVRAVELGGGYSVLTEGLAPGARVVTEGASLLAQVR
jgi:hypothetical protein